MKKFAYIVVVVGAIASLGAARLLTEPQAMVGGTLQELGLEKVQIDTDLIGAAPKYKVTKKTLEHLHKLMKEEKTITVSNSGELEID